MRQSLIAVALRKDHMNKLAMSLIAVVMVVLLMFGRAMYDGLRK